MSASAARVSLVISTVNRTSELARLMDSLIEQEFKDFEIIVVDQNCDDRLVPVLEPYQSQLNIERIKTSGRHGVSSGRNDGWCRARGEFVVFPDDDCWYPTWFLRKGLDLLDATKAELVSGRSTDETGRTINGRFARRAQFITRRRVWFTQAEWITFYRRELFEKLRGFDEGLGIGSSSPWQAAEGPDLVLKALERGVICYYDPALYGYHREYDLDSPTSGMAKKGRGYAHGMGFVLRRHRFGLLSLIHWGLRPLVTAFISAIMGRFYRAYYSLSVSLGRIEGWLGRTWSHGMPSHVGKVNARTTPVQDKLRHGSIADGGPSARYGKQLREMIGPYRARNPVLIAGLYATDYIARILPKKRGKISKDRPLRVLVANWGHLGDVVTILPLLKFLETHPRVEALGVLIGSWSRPVLEATNINARIHICDHWWLDRGNKSLARKIADYLFGLPRLIKTLSQCRYDLSIDIFATFPPTHGITWCASIPRRIGFTSGGFGALLTDAFRWVPDDDSMLQHQLKLLKPLLGNNGPPNLPPSYPGFNSLVPADLLELDGKPYIVVHMGPQSVRGWVADKWAEVGAALKRQGYELVVTGSGSGEVAAAQVLGEKVPLRNLSGRLSWKQFVATLANASAIVTIDSVAGHLAACFGVPVVVLAAGRQRLNLWRPNSANANMLTHTVGCAPCNRTRGCAAMACVRLIEVDEVVSSAEQVMKLSRTGSSERIMPGLTGAPN